MSNTTPAPNPTPLDERHARIVDAVMLADRRRVAGGEKRFVRFLVPHELCPGPCIALSPMTMVEVVSLGDGLRSRRPLPILGGVA